MHAESTAADSCSTCGAPSEFRHVGLPGGLELHLCGPLHVLDPVYALAGQVTERGGGSLPDGSSLQVRSLTTGLCEEAFLDGEGRFRQAVEVVPTTDNELELAVCDPAGREKARVLVRLRPCRPAQAEHGGAAVTPGQAGPELEPPWQEFARLVRRCLDLAASLADASGRQREELFEHIYTQERYAEQAWTALNPVLYRECVENLQNYAGYLERMLHDALPMLREPEEDAQEALARFRQRLAEVWRGVRNAGRKELEARLAQAAARGQGLSQQVKTDPVTAVRTLRQLAAEVARVEEALHAGTATSGE
jgi:hypothetical protein